MNLSINKIKILVGVLGISLLMTACHSHEEGDGHDHSHGNKSSAKQEESHDEEENSNQTSLTDEQIKAVDIRLGKIENKELTATLKANGLLRVPNNNKGNATALFGGVVQTLNVQIGSNVRKGQTIATIANPQFIQIQEEYMTTINRIVLAEQELQRQQELNEGNAGAKRNLQSATSELNALRTRRSSLQQQIQMMGINPSALANGQLKSVLTVTSPVSGTVSEVFAMIGSYVDVSSPIAEIVDNSSLHLDLQVFEKDLPRLRVGQVIHFTLTNNPGTVYDAKVFSIGASFENESKTIAVHSSVIGNKTGLIDGMNITGVVSLDNALTAAVPNEAIVEADGKFYIIVKMKDDHEHKEGESHDHAEEGTKFEKIEIFKGVSDMGYTAITPVRELAPDAEVVVKGAFFINAKMSDSGGHAHAH